ncbi:serine hydrolase [Rhodohalobacter sp. SW132]|uniref:serine hydrolase n=1 Tax=Rhodohalobacter sp. SW132 TaxID=2293433 RepID=UPI000E23A345|nr:serine hydrolase [Rhodohalobacter sp. SW132]REL38944.1 serine hydrolase [Rhodohalobacter sp. SW132]
MRIIKLCISLLLVIILSSCSHPDETVSLVELRDSIESILDNEEGTYAVYFSDLDDSQIELTINPDTLFHAASTMKTPVMIEVFRRADAGEFSVYDSIRIDNRFYSIVDGSEFSLDLDPESDDPFERMEGEMATIYDLTNAMITYSSNITTNLMIDLVGAEETTRTMRELGAENIEVLRGVYDMKAFEQNLSNRTTARDLAIIFRSIADGTAADRESGQLMIDILSDQFYRDIIPKYLPEELIIANKTGSISGVEHDSGIVYLPDGRSYLLIYLSKNVPDDEHSRDVGARISELIYDFYMANPTGTEL